MVSLTPITGRDVSRDVLEGFPEIHTYRNALVMPKLQGPLDPEAGLFDETGLRISAGDLLHGYPTVRKMTQSQFHNRGHDDAVICNRDAVYGGNLELHYGHFITECLNTLWYILTYQNSHDLVVFLSSRTLEEIYRTPWAASLLNFAGVPKERARVVTTPVQFRRLIVPGKAFLEDSFVFAGYASFCEAVGRRLAAPWHGAKAIYLSREKVRGGSVRMENEHELSKALVDRGLQVVFPEELSVAEQIGLYRSGNCVVGQIGSSFHTSIFSESAKGIALSPSDSVRRSFELMDAAHACNIDYYQMSRRRPASNQTAGFIVSYAIDGVKEMADEILTLSSLSRTGQRNINTMPKPPAHLVSIVTRYQESLFIGDESVVLSRRDTEVGLGSKLFGVVIGKYLLLAAESFPRGKFCLLSDHEAAQVWGFKMEAMVGRSAVCLRSGISGRYLTMPPSQARVAARAGGLKPDLWEEVLLQKTNSFQAAARVQSIITTYLSDKQYSDDWVKHSIGDMPVSDWMNALAV